MILELLSEAACGLWPSGLYSMASDLMFTLTAQVITAVGEE